VTRKHGPDAYVVLLNDGGAVATVGPFEEREQAEKYSVAVRQFIETEQEMKQVMKDLTEDELGQLMQTFFMVQEKIYARD
jgi:hypothetical protein